MTRFATTTNTAVDLLVNLALESQIGGFQAKLEKKTDIIHGEAGSVWQGMVTHQSVAGHLDGMGGWHTGKMRHYIERHQDFWVGPILSGDEL